MKPSTTFVTFRLKLGSIKHALKHKSLDVKACTSGTNATKNLNWFMMPETAFPVNIFVNRRVAGAKFKGYTRDLLESVHISSPPTM